MTTLNLFIVSYAVELSILIRLISCVIISFFLLPLQLREAKVKNGLSKLRYQLLAAGIILFFTNVASLFFLYDAWSHGTPQRLLNSWLQIINAVAFLALSVIAWLIYIQQYSEVQKELHRKISKLEE